MEHVTAYTSDDAAPQLTLDSLRKTMMDFRAKHGRPLKAIKISEQTLRQMEQMFPLYPSTTMNSSLYGVRIEIDNELALWECVPVYA